MFERVLETVLTKALGEFVQDIDSKDLKLAVWKGNVVLKNLRLKAEALAKFDLPVFVYAGLIGSLELQVPWKALWSSPTKVVVEDLVLLVIPKDAAPYSEEKTKLEERQRKRGMLDAVKEAQERMREKGRGAAKEGKPTWAESLITAIVKNLEIRVKNIHLRYEDPESGYSIGVTLDELFALTTNESWQPTVLSDSNVGRIYKLAKVSHFAVYWNNPATQLFQRPSHEIEKELLNLIVTSDRPNKEHKFVIHPMGCLVKIIIDPTNKVVMDTPKASLSVHFTSLVTEVRKTQYLDTMVLLDHMERGKKKQAFAKWHPGVQILGNSMAWWNYLYRYCYETRVKRRVIAWRWETIKKHRDNCREYTALRVKEMTGKPTLNEISRIIELFDILDIVNITICEQNAKVESDKITASSGGWFGSWWGGGSNKNNQSVADRFGLTKDEKDTLYKAIEQSEAAASSQIYPENYIKIKLKLDVDKVSFKLNDDTKLIAEAAVQGITSELGIIPHGNGIHLSYHIQTVYVVSDKTSILTPTDSSSIVPIAEGEVRMNPSDVPADIVILSKFSSVTLLFDMNLINSVIDFTRTEAELTEFDELRRNIDYYSDQLKTQGKSGMLYAIEKRKVVDVTVTLSAPKVVIPESGCLQSDGPLIVADLGRLVLTTQVGETRSERQLLSMSLAELEETAYDNYNLNLENFHLKMFANKDEWAEDFSMTLDSFLLYPIKLDVNLAVSILPDDKNIPKIKCKGHLDTVQLVMSDKKLNDLFRIIDSLPKGEPVPVAPQPTRANTLIVDDIWVDVNKIADITDVTTSNAEVAKVEAIRQTDFNLAKSPASIVSTESEDNFYDAPDHFLGQDDQIITEDDTLELISQTIIMADFTLNNIMLKVLKESNFEGKVVLKSHIKNISATVQKTTWMHKVEASLGEIEVLDCFTGPSPIALITSPPNGTLISVAAQMNDSKSPYFDSDFKSTEMAVLGTFDKLSLKLHVDSFLNLYEFGVNLLPQQEESTDETLDSCDIENTSNFESVGTINEDLIKVHASALVNSISLTLEASGKTYADISISNCNAEVIMRPLTTEVISSLKSLDVSQSSEVENYPDILSVDSDKFTELISFRMIQYKDKMRKVDPDMDVSLKMGSLNFIFLNFFIQNLLHVLDTFSNTKEKMVSASIETAKLAQESSNSTVIKLSVEVESPVVKIPRSSDRKEGYKVKLGNISLKNTFSLTNEEIIQEKISIQISHVELSRVVLSSYGHVVLEQSMVEPVEMDLEVVRCLCNNSDIDIVTNLKNITVKSGHEDYHMLLKTLEENFAETGDRLTPPEDGVSIEEVEVDGCDESGDTTAGVGSSEGGEIKLKMQVEEAKCFLYTDEDKYSVDGHSRGVRHRDKMIMYSETRGIIGDVTLLGDGSKKVNLKVWDIRVEDTDPVVRENGIQRILAHKQLANEEVSFLAREDDDKEAALDARRAIVIYTPNAMIDATIDMGNQGDMVIDSKIQDTHVVVSWGFINNIITFFTVSPFDTGDSGVPGGAQSPPPPSIIARNMAEEAEEGGSGQSGRILQVKLAVENPEVAFLSNHKNSKTQALLLRTDLELRLNQSEEQTSIQVSVDRITMFICQYINRLTSIYLLLQPCNLVATYSKIDGEKESVDLNISELIFNISPETLNIMMQVSTQFSGGETVNAAKIEHTTYAYNMWEIESIDENNRWYIRQATTNLLQDKVRLFLTRKTEPELFPERKPLGQTLVLNMDKYHITLEADYEPLVVVTGKTTCTVKDWAGAMLIDMDLSMEANYYSYTLGTYEPILEPVELDNGLHRMWNMTLSVSKCPLEVSSQAAQFMQILGADSSTDSQADTMSLSSVDSLEVVDNAPPIFDVHITSNDKLMLTLTNSALKNLQILGDAWSKVQDDKQILPKAVSPLMIQNYCGVDVVVRGKASPGRAPPPEFTLEHTEKQALKLEMGAMTRSKDRTKKMSQNAMLQTDVSETASINVKVEGYEEVKDIPIVQAGLYIYALVPIVDAPKKERRLGRQLTRTALTEKLTEASQVPAPKTTRHILVEVTVVRTSKTITIRSPLHFHNLQRAPVRLWYSVPADNNNSELVSVDIETFQVECIAPGDRYYVPLDASLCGALDSHHFHISPDSNSFSPSLPSLSTSTLRQNGATFVTSSPDSVTSPDTALRGKAQACHGALSIKPLSVRNPTKIPLQDALYHTICISPALVIANKLPVTLRISGIGFQSTEIGAGAREHFDHIDVSSDPTVTLRIMNYHNMGYDWCGELSMSLKKFQESPMTTITMTTSGSTVANKVNLGVMVKLDDGLMITVYCNYWMVNCTGKSLRYQGFNDTAETTDPAEPQQPMLFSFSTVGKNKLRVSVDNAGWSDYFSIDTVGSGGSVKSVDESTGFCYEIGVSVTLSNIQLTNIVTFYPRFQVINELQTPISVTGNVSRDAARSPRDTSRVTSSCQLIECPSNKVTPFWPGSKDDHKIIIKIKDGEPSMAIPLGTTQQTVIRMEYPGDDTPEFTSLVVFVDVRQATTEIKVGLYYLGAAPVRIENLLKHSSICFQQVGGMFPVTLAPNRSVLYTWDFPDKKREMHWHVEGDEKNSKKAEFIKDNCTGFVYTEKSTQQSKKAQLVSFLDGLQRVLLFTDDPNIVDAVSQEVIKIEQSQMVVEVSFPQSIGISLVDSTPQEVTYIQLDSSGAIWERRLKHRNRYKYLSNKISEELEAAFNSEGKEIAEFDDHSFDMRNGDEMRLTFPNQTSTNVRRTYLPALWFQYTTSNSQTNMHFKVNKIQIDNQLLDHTFRHVFYPISPPSHAVALQPPKPLIEFSMIKQITSVEGQSEQSVLEHYKYLKLLIQEFHIKLDAVFLLSVINFFRVDQEDIEDKEQQEQDLLWADVKFSQSSLDDKECVDDNAPVFFDEFHLSPLKIHISFSPEVNIDTSQGAVGKDVLALYLKSFGLGLVAINDAVLKLAYYDAAGQLCTISQLQDRVVKHYVFQTLSQLYAVVLGLDILGNPYGLAQDIKAGTRDLFYEPYVGIVQGPREFAEGVVIGVNSFLRHSVGGVVGAASKITRTLGKGLAKLTFDEDYQRQRARRMAHKPGHIGEGLARGGKSFLMGLYHGVTGVVMKPVEGAAQDGVEGFFKGVGKGLVGAVTRPLGGINDMITYTIDGIHHHTQIDEKVLVLRHPRYIHADKILRPYNPTKSEGKYLLGQIARNTHWDDMYYHHCLLNRKSAFLLTDVRCIMSGYDEVMNCWKVDWSHVYVDIEKIPLVLDDGLGIIFSAYMDPNQGMSKFFKNRRKKTRTVALPSVEDTKSTLTWFRAQLQKVDKKRFAGDELEKSKCWDKCCRCL